MKIKNETKSTYYLLAQTPFFLQLEKVQGASKLPHKKEEYMKTRNLSEHRSQLLQRLAEVEAANTNIKTKLSEAAETQTNVLQDFLDHASEQTNLCAHLEMNEKYVKERLQILCAIDRINKGSFGTCDECGETISDKRLLVQPSAPLCWECQHLKEASAGSDIVSVQKLNQSNSFQFSFVSEEAANYEKINQNHNPAFYNDPIKCLFDNECQPEQIRSEC